MAAQRRTPSQILGFRGGFLDKVKSLLKPEEKGGVSKVRGWGGGQMSSSRQTEQHRQIQGLERGWHIRVDGGGGKSEGVRAAGERERNGDGGVEQVTGRNWPYEPHGRITT